MKYVALFLDGENYIEKCLILIKAICAPRSKTPPHITLRLFKEDDERINMITQQNINRINLIGPGSFNISDNDIQNNGEKLYIVFLKCESEQLEGIDYRPDYPFSRLHITLYEGNDLAFAKQLLGVLETLPWQFSLSFVPPKHLVEQKLGEKNRLLSYEKINNILAELLGDVHLCRINEMSNAEKLCMIKEILSKIVRSNQFAQARQVHSLYNDDELSVDSHFMPKSPQFINYTNTITCYDIGNVNKDTLGYYVTPPEYANEMATCALNYFPNNSTIDFGDSAVGSGVLFLALKRQLDLKDNNKPFKKAIIRSAIGIDNDKKMALEAYLRCSKRGLTVILGDALSPEIELGEKRNLMMVNPPYDRHEEIPFSYKQLLRKLAMDQTGIQVSKKSGLYVYHLLIMDKWLADNGIAVWLIPSAFLQTKYGEAVRQYLTKKVKLLRIHQYDAEATQFDKAMVSTTIVVFRKETPQLSDSVSFSYGKSLETPVYCHSIRINQLLKSSNWNCLLSPKTETNSTLSTIQFSDLFTIKRGIATGANSFFVLNRETAIRNGIPDIALKPILPKARFLQDTIICADEEGYPKVKPQLVLIDSDMTESEIKKNYPLFYEYLLKAKEPDASGRAIVERTLVKSRKPWYKQEEREVPMFLLTYMGRKKENNTYLSFFLNKSNAIALNTYIMLYPKPWLSELLQNDPSLVEQLFIALKLTASSALSEIGRVYSGGLRKVEPNELKNAIIRDLPPKIEAQIQK